MNLPQIIPERISSLKQLIGNTPLLAIGFTFKDEHRTIYAKAEDWNMTGSIKDRMALHILEHAYVTGQLRPGDRIVEATSGNTGISFAALGRALGHAVRIYMPDWMSLERVALMESYGATIVPVTSAQGGLRGSIEMADKLALENDDVFVPRQFSNEVNVRAHEETTGPEIIVQLESRGLKPDAFVAGVGTGGTIMGVGRALRAAGYTAKAHPLLPNEAPLHTNWGRVFRHRIEGIAEEFIPDIVHLNELDHIVSVADGDAIIMAQKLAREIGLGVGISSGANFLGALMIQNELGKDAVVVTVFPDDNKKYLSTDLRKEEPMKTGYLSADVRLVGFRTIECVRRAKAANPS